MAMFLPQWWSTILSRWVRSGALPPCRGGSGQVARLVLGDHDVGVARQPVDGGGGGGQRLGHELLEPIWGWVQVARDGQGAALVGGVDQPVETIGGVGADRQQADVVDCWPSASTKWLLPVPEGRRCTGSRVGADPLQGAQRLLGGSGDGAC